MKRILFSRFLIFILICLIFYNYKLIKLFILYIDSYIELQKYQNLLYINKKNLRLLKYKKNFFPNISIISPIYNREVYLLRFLNNIQNQYFKEIEIIVIDDCSIDNSIKIIEEYIKKDKRMILLKNKIKRGTFINRNIGILFSKGKYIVFYDSDDMISKNILNICFKYAEKYNFEMIGYMNLENGIIISNVITNKPIFKKELTLYQFYRDNKLDSFDHVVWNKLIKKKILIGALNSLNNNYFLNLFITMGEDFFFNYFLYKEANSFIILKKIGYYYIQNKQSITRSLMTKSKLLISFKLLIIKIFFENTKNNKYEKDIINLLISEYFKYLDILLGSYNFYYYKSFFNSNIINNYLNCKFINDENKFFMRKIKNKIEKSY